MAEGSQASLEGRILYVRRLHLMSRYNAYTEHICRPLQTCQIRNVGVVSKNASTLNQLSQDNQEKHREAFSKDEALKIRVC
ncbi:hypothetical protein J6590_095283 [Homalodisca vitripennis]|nr:hypothetical protein J6590_095283 [Homalodisca vitripennis]